MPLYINPDASLEDEAESCKALYLKAQDILAVYTVPDGDTRRVCLNNVSGAASAATSILRILASTEGDAGSSLISMLGLAKPEYLQLTAGDLYRAAKLHLLLESQFQIETSFRNLLAALGHAEKSTGFFRVAKAMITATGVPNPDGKLTLLNIPAALRNSLHSNGIHHSLGYPDVHETIGGLVFDLEDGKRLRCGSVMHITAAIGRSLDIVDEVYKSAVVTALHDVQDSYAAQAASGT